MGSWTEPLLWRSAMFSHYGINNTHHVMLKQQPQWPVFFRVWLVLTYSFDPIYSFQIISVHIHHFALRQESIVRKCKSIAGAIVASVCDASETPLTWHESTLPCRNPAHIMLWETAPLYTEDLLHTLESMIFTTAFCSVGGTAAEWQKSTGQLNYSYWSYFNMQSCCNGNSQYW